MMPAKQESSPLGNIETRHNSNPTSRLRRKVPGPGNDRARGQFQDPSNSAHGGPSAWIWPASEAVPEAGLWGLGHSRAHQVCDRTPAGTPRTGQQGPATRGQSWHERGQQDTHRSRPHASEDPILALVQPYTSLWSEEALG